MRLLPLLLRSESKVSLEVKYLLPNEILVILEAWGTITPPNDDKVAPHEFILPFASYGYQDLINFMNLPCRYNLKNGRINLRRDSNEIWDCSHKRYSMIEVINAITFLERNLDVYKVEDPENEGVFFSTIFLTEIGILKIVEKTYLKKYSVEKTELRKKIYTVNLLIFISVILVLVLGYEYLFK